jgi:hypothetical protein
MWQLKTSPARARGIKNEHMTKLLTAISIFFFTGLSAQELRLNAYTSYAFDDRINSTGSVSNFFEGRVNGGLIWGGGLEYVVDDSYGVELSYLRMDTKAPMTYARPGTGVRNETFDVALNYIFLGGTGYKKLNPVVELFGGMQLGAAVISVRRPREAQLGEEVGNATKFAWGLRGGANLYPGGDDSRVGLKLQIGLLSPVQAIGGGLFFGTGGAGAGITTFSSMTQFTMGGGLTFRLKQ